MAPNQEVVVHFVCAAVHSNESVDNVHVLSSGIKAVLFYWNSRPRHVRVGEALMNLIMNFLDFQKS